MEIYKSLVFNVTFSIACSALIVHDVFNNNNNNNNYYYFCMVVIAIFSPILFSLCGLQTSQPLEFKNKPKSIYQYTYISSKLIILIRRSY